MNISLNIILDSISHYRYELHIGLPTELSFHRISLLPKEMGDVKPNCLYVCQLSEALRAAGQVPQIYCLCLRDRIRDELETEEKLKGMIIINENLELVTLFTMLQETFILINDWYKDMQEAVIMKKSMQDIISLSEPVIGNFISVSDSAFSLLAYTKNIPTDDPISIFLIENKFHSEETVKKFKEIGRLEVWMDSRGLITDISNTFSKYTVISKVFRFNDIYFIHVVMTTTHRKLTPGLLDLFSHMIYVLSYYIIPNWEEEKNYSHVYNTLVTDLMECKLTDMEAVNERARIVGFKPADEYIIMILSVGNGGDFSFPGRVARDIARMFPYINPVYYNCRLLLLLHHADIASLIEDNDMEALLNAYFHENNIFCGCSDKFENLLELPNAYQQAVLALNGLNSGCQNGGIGWGESTEPSNIAHFRTYYASCILDRSEQSERLWRNSRYGKMLIAIYESDVDKNTNNLEVLYTYLVNERRATETATQLHMHRNNVIYRISRIEKFLGLSLEDRLVRMNLTISLFMLRYSGFLQEHKYPRQRNLP